MQTIKDWQFFRTFYMKGCLFRAKRNLNSIRQLKRYTVNSEDSALTNAIAHIDFVIRSYNKNSLRLKPWKKDTKKCL